MASVHNEISAVLIEYKYNDDDLVISTDYIVKYFEELVLLRDSITALKSTYLIVEFYIDAAKEYRYRVKARNGRIMMDCGEGYTRYVDCTNAFYKINTIWCIPTGRIKYKWSKDFK